jgi:ribosomal protein S18 acetylase RimI-like enzyme
MSSIEVRPFRRGDREQLTGLVNAHTAAVVPGMSVSVNTVLSQLEREPGEFIVDPWVRERATLVTQQRQRIVAAAHLRRFGDGEDVSEGYRGAGEIRWFVFWPWAPYWPDSTDAAEALMAACLALLDKWAVEREYADGTLPAPGIYGLPEQWPHVRGIFEGAGFEHDGHTEVVYIATVDDLPRPARPPLPELSLRRSLGINGTRLSAVLGTEVVGYIEVDTFEGAERLPRHGGWADIGNFAVMEEHRRRGIATWLVAEAAEWLRLAGVERVLDYAWANQEVGTAFAKAVGFRELTRTQRGWVRAPSRPA